LYPPGREVRAGDDDVQRGIAPERVNQVVDDSITPTQVDLGRDHDIARCGGDPGAQGVAASAIVRIAEDAQAWRGNGSCDPLRVVR
jgi:hypothetical protein